MVHLYEKGPKTEDCEFGIREITDENPFENGPCVLVLVAVPDHLRDINGSLRAVANMVNPHIDQGIDSNRRLLGLGYGSFDEISSTHSRRYPDSDELREFIEKYFKPLFTKDEKKLDIIDAMKKMRNVTFVTYCNGDRHFDRIRNKLKEVLLECGYTEKEIDLIYCQICIATVVSNNLKSDNNKMVMINFADEYDRHHEENQELRYKISKSMSYPCSDLVKFINYGSYLGCIACESDDHSFYRYMNCDGKFGKLISDFINASLDNAIENKNSEEFIPITYEKILCSMNETVENLRKGIVRRKKH